MGGEVVSCVVCRLEGSQKGSQATRLLPSKIVEPSSAELCFLEKNSSAYEPDSRIKDFVLYRWVIPTS